MYSSEKFIHLLFSPTNFCNMGCKYCYLGSKTDELSDTSIALDTLRFAIDKFLAEGIVPFNLSLHGGEPTSIPKNVLSDIFAFIKSYYDQQREKISAAGFPLNPLHIKTNLLNFDKLYDVFDNYEVSISGSVDLPLSLHGKYRTDKKGNSTLEKIKSNLALLADYPHHKKISCVVTKEHIAHMDEFIQDIKFIHYDIGLDMSKFNIMFSFDSEESQKKFGENIPGTEMLSQEEQVLLYETLKKEFLGSELEEGFKKHWFKEFTPEFCCSAVNCGEKFFLLQSNGDIFACPRGQASENFLYGNIYEKTAQDIIDSGTKTIEAMENTTLPNEECYSCHYLPYCNQGCIFVRKETEMNKSYTCKLQKEIYRDNPEKYPAYTTEQIVEYSKRYQFRNGIQSVKFVQPIVKNTRYITEELSEDRNSLSEIIARDPTLKSVFSDQCFKLEVDKTLYSLKSPTLNNAFEISALNQDSRIYLHVIDGVFDISCKYPVNNYIYIMLLRNTLVSYGDEGRTKQEHLVDLSLYKNSFEAMAEKKDGWWVFDLTTFIAQARPLFLPGVRNNLYVTTKSLREYHYQQQKNNAFYHIQAINLPFPFIEFYYAQT